MNTKALRRGALVPMLGDLFLFAGAMALSFGLREPILLTKATLLSFTPLFGLWLTTFYALGLYETQVVRDFVSLIGSLLGAALVSWILGSTYFYLFSPYLHLTPKTHLVVTIALSHVGVFVWRRVWLWALDIDLLRQRLVFLGDEEQVRSITLSLTAFREGTWFVPAEWRWPGIDMVVADPEWVEHHWNDARAVLSEAVRHRVPVIGIDAFYEALTGKVSPDWAGRPSWAIEHILPRSGSSYAFVKRLIDAVSACLMMLVLAPLFVGLYALISVADRMPPLYGQRRIGFLGREFTLWKFRTMRPGADSDGPFRIDRESDARVTKLGRVLRRYRLDELPQLWNVLRGEMSMVGPRPEWIKEVEVLETQVPNYHLRHLVPPGITGWAQVYYRATNDPRESFEKHHYDLYYLKHFSFALDFSILLKTAKRVMVRDARVARGPAPFSLRTNRAMSLDVGSIISRA